MDQVLALEVKRLWRSESVEFEVILLSVHAGATRLGLWDRQRSQGLTLPIEPRALGDCATLNPGDVAKVTCRGGDRARIGAVTAIHPA